MIKFGPKVRDIDRQYEINNNADLDNGVYHKFDEENAEGNNEEDKPAEGDEAAADNALQPAPSN